MEPGAIRSRYEKDRVEHQRQSYGSPGHSRCPKAPERDRPAPTTGRPVNAQDQWPAYASNFAEEHERPPGAEGMRGCRREVRRESGHASADLALRRDPQEVNSTTVRAE